LVQCGYVGAQALCFLVYYYVSFKVTQSAQPQPRPAPAVVPGACLSRADWLDARLQIKSKNDTKKVKYTEAAKPMSSEAPVEVETTVREYDLAEVEKAVRGLAIGIAIVRAATTRLVDV